MEGLLGLLAFVALAGFILGPILAIIALARVGQLRGLQQQVNDLAARIAGFEARIARLSRPGAAPAASAPQPIAGPPHPAATPPATAIPAGPPAQPPRAPGVSSAPPPILGDEETARPVRPAAPGAMGPPGAMPPPGAPPGPPTAHVPPATRVPPVASSRPDAPPPEFTQVAAKPIDWERWVGIRGAAVLGAVALGLAGLLFFKYSIERGLITPVMRVVFGTITGLGCIVGSEGLRKRAYDATAEGVSGAGVVILYAAFWAAHALYGLIGMTTSFVLMVLVTAACCLLAVRHSSQIVAVIGLVGGFATPLLLSSGADRPIGLFGYVMLLDIGLIAVGRRRAWPLLGLLSLVGTVLMQGLWIGARMGPDRLALGLVILGVFAALFAVAGRGADTTEAGRPWRWSQYGAILFPFAFALVFAGRVELGPHLYPIALLMALLSAGAGWVARAQNEHRLGSGAAAGCIAVVGVWLMQHTLTLPLAWEVVGTAVGLAAIFHLLAELGDATWNADSPAPAAILSTCGLFVLLLFAAASVALPPWPWLAGWGLLAALLYRQAGFPDLEALPLAAATGLGVGLSILHLAHSRGAYQGAPAAALAIEIAAALALLAAAQLKREPEVTRFAGHAAALLPVLLLVGLMPSPLLRSLGPALGLGSTLLLGMLALAAATRLGSGGWYAGAVGATLLAHLAWTWERPGLRDQPEAIGAALLFEAAAVVLYTVWPFLVPARFKAEPAALYAAALAGPAWFPALRRLFTWKFGDGFIGLLPLLLGALALAAVVGARRVFPPADPARRSALVWFAAVALCFAAVAIPLQLEKEWITMGWALEGLAVIALWTRLDHPGLKWFGLALLAATSVRLVANPALLGYYPRSAQRLVNWLLYTYLVPAAALFGSAALLRPSEAERGRDWEEGLYAGGRAVGAAGAVVAAIVVVFVWINLAIADWYATGATLTLSFGDQPPQRLTVSIAWAIYALALLGFGMGYNSTGLRWISLVFLLVTIGKVFLYDLGALGDLYRVASLLGLAVSLILVSLLYQRFVFRRTRGAGDGA